MSGQPPRAAASMATASWPTLVSPYEPRTPSGLSSDSITPVRCRDGVDVGRPDDQHERRPRQATDGLHRAGSVPPTLTCRARAGSASASGAKATAARCTTASVSRPGPRRSRPGSVTSSSRWPGAVTACPASWSSPWSRRPTNPLPPVSRTRKAVRPLGAAAAEVAPDVSGGAGPIPLEVGVDHHLDQAPEVDRRAPSRARPAPWWRRRAGGRPRPGG